MATARVATTIHGEQAGGIVSMVVATLAVAMKHIPTGNLSSYLICCYVEHHGSCGKVPIIAIARLNLGTFFMLRA